MQGNSGPHPLPRILWGSGTQILTLFPWRAVDFQSKMNQMAAAGLECIIRKFCPDLNTSQICSISHICAGLLIVFTTLLVFHWPAVKQFCRLYIMITASTHHWPGWDDVKLLLPAGWTATKFLHRSWWKWSGGTVFCSLSCLDVPSYIGSPDVECKNTGLISWKNKKKKSLGIRNLKLLPPFWKHREE